MESSARLQSRADYAALRYGRRLRELRSPVPSEPERLSPADVAELMGAELVDDTGWSPDTPDGVPATRSIRAHVGYGDQSGMGDSRVRLGERPKVGRSHRYSDTMASGRRQPNRNRRYAAGLERVRELGRALDPSPMPCLPYQGSNPSPAPTFAEPEPPEPSPLYGYRESPAERWELRYRETGDPWEPHPRAGAPDPMLDAMQPGYRRIGA